VIRDVKKIIFQYVPCHRCLAYVWPFSLKKNVSIFKKRIFKLKGENRPILGDARNCYSSIGVLQVKHDYHFTDKIVQITGEFSAAENVVSNTVDENTKHSDYV